MWLAAETALPTPSEAEMAAPPSSHALYHLSVAISMEVANTLSFERTERTEGPLHTQLISGKHMCLFS